MTNETTNNDDVTAMIDTDLVHELTTLRACVDLIVGSRMTNYLHDVSGTMMNRYHTLQAEYNSRNLR